MDNSKKTTPDIDRADMEDAFFSDEDLDLKNLSFEELVRQWNLWLYQAQSTNDLDQHRYSHGVFSIDN